MSDDAGKEKNFPNTMPAVTLESLLKKLYTERSWGLTLLIVALMASMWASSATNNAPLSDKLDVYRGCPTDA